MIQKDITTSVPEGEGQPSWRNRRGRRVEYSCRLFFSGQDEFDGEGTLLNISTTGCRASSSTPVHIGMRLDLWLFLPDHKWPLRVEQAVVRWVDGQEFGMEFIVIRLAQRERIRAVVMQAEP